MFRPLRPPGGAHAPADGCHLVCSGFEYFPGGPLLHSRDPVHGRQIGNVFDRPARLPSSDDPPAPAGIPAPTIRHHDGRFHEVAVGVADGGTFLVTVERAGDPRPKGCGRRVSAR
ncbi:family 43 glycosylhydrolase [Streptomyces sp. NPDC017936]|uniref:family 43 glycosylhydrolase n=1 Tax=Streptomyces sp. NPDC017936 TaxID=3365016 RepID=UPI003789BCD2